MRQSTLENTEELSGMNLFINNEELKVPTQPRNARADYVTPTDDIDACIEDDNSSTNEDVYINALKDAE